MNWLYLALVSVLGAWCIVSSIRNIRRSAAHERLVFPPAEPTGKRCVRGHDGYWRAHFGKCLACRCEDAEEEARVYKARAEFETDQVRHLAAVVDVAQRLDVALAALNTLPKSMDGTELDNQRLMAVKIEQVALMTVLEALREWQRQAAPTDALAALESARAEGGRQ